MNTNIEKEYAVLLTKEQYEEIASSLDFKEKTQINYYYASPFKNIGIRIRELNNEKIFTLKKEDDGNTYEYEVRIDDISLDHPEIQDILKKHHIQNPYLLGKLETKRKIFNFPQGELALDASTYLGITDYELEYELFSHDQGDSQVLQDLLKAHNIPYIENEVTKYARFIKRRQELKVAIICAQGSEECEALMVYDLLKRAGIKVELVSIEKSLKLASSHGLAYHCDVTIEDIDPENYSAIVLPGGLPGTYRLQEHPTVNALIDSFFKEKKLLCAICAAPHIFIVKGLVKDGEFIVFPGFENGHVPSDAYVVQKDNIITAESLGWVIEFTRLIIANLYDEDTAAKTVAQIMQEK